MLELLEQAKQLGIDITLIEFYEDKDNNYHWYDYIDDKLMINLKAERCMIDDIVHEYVHHIQAKYLGTQALIKELDLSYGKRLHEIHALLVEEAYNTFINNDGVLDEEEIIDYYYECKEVLGY